MTATEVVVSVVGAAAIAWELWYFRAWGRRRSAAPGARPTAVSPHQKHE